MIKLVGAGFGGSIGRSLTQKLSTKYAVLRLRRGVSAHPVSGASAEVLWEPTLPGGWEPALEGAVAVVNLCGAGIADTRWTDLRKRELVSSRLESTRALVAAMSRMRVKPKVFVNASAVGYYGARGPEPLTERSANGRGFLAELCQKWEDEAAQAEALGIRTVMLRTGIVLTPSGGALAKMLPFFRAFLGGPLGSGRQMMSWIHIDDHLRAVEKAIEDERVRGPINLTAPDPVTMNEFSRTLGRVLRRPSLLPAPAFALKALLGEMSEVVLQGQNALPTRLTETGFVFRYPRLEDALRSLLSQSA